MKKGFIIFTRLPIPGQTKTRLEGCLTKKQCSELHKNMLKDLNETSKNIDADIFISYTPNGDTKILSEIFTVKNKKFSQRGEDIWFRMYDSMNRVFNMGYDRVVLIGADIPEMSYKHINKSFKVLDNVDVVITPTEDNGYCLIGSKKPIKEIFEMYNVSKDKTVIENTIVLVCDAGLTVHINEKLLDLDEGEDLEELTNSTRYRKLDFGNTRKYLRERGY
ncbi:TIGR04282 family arsenosugar biosynthesis glycosyltransferase [Peptostreptococcus russellii]|uniref:TIGR04282 family arsenosugar biosynthesis glycosyltransferase n=1 Tax=Peptostreptococcus russellii TaxID=215200 RepID=UPI0029421C33|nr:TIGR04282 family arsenosugar biosynthesis glycosyltransferase [Peptostreptococcus russellii]